MIEIDFEKNFLFLDKDFVEIVFVVEMFIKDLDCYLFFRIVIVDTFPKVHRSHPPLSEMFLVVHVDALYCADFPS